MRRILIAAVLLLLALPAAAQFTQVSGTVIDPNGIPYANGTIAPFLVNNSGQSVTLNGQAYTPPTQPAGLDKTGSFVINLAASASLSPGTTQWNFWVCSAVGTVNPSIGTGSQCFTLAAPITIAGASQSITTQLHAAALALTNPGTSAGGTPGLPFNSVQVNCAGSFCGDSLFLWSTAVHAGSVGSDSSTSVPGTTVYLLGSENFSITNNFQVLGTWTGSGSAMVAQASFSIQNIVNPAANDHLTFYAGENVITQTPSALTSDLGSIEGIFGEARYNGTGTVGGGGAGDGGITAIDGEAFMESSSVLGAHGGRGIFGNFGYLGSGNSPSGVGAGGEFQFEIGNGSSGTLGQGYGVIVDQPQNFGGTGTTVVAAYSSLQLNCVLVGFITTQSCLTMTGAAPNTLGTGTTSAGQIIAGGTSGSGTAAAPLLAFGNAAHTFGMYVPAAGVLGWSMNSTQVMDLDFNWGLYLIDGSCLGFSTTTTTQSKDTGLCRPAASVVSVGDGSNANAVNGGLLASGHLVPYTASTAVTAGQPLKADPANSTQVRPTVTTDTGAGVAIGFAWNSVTAGNKVYLVANGVLTTPLLGTGTCAIGNFVIVDTTTNGDIKCTATYTAGTVLGVATVANAVVGTGTTVAVGLR